MKTKRILLYIVFAFSLFLIGSTRVHAAHYLMCRYELSANDATAASISGYKKTQFVEVLYINGVYRGSTSNQPKDSSANGNYHWTLGPESRFNKIIELQQKCSASTEVCWKKCPTVKFAGYLMDNNSAMDANKWPKKRIKPTKSSQVFYKNIMDKKCSYKVGGKDYNNVVIYYDSTFKNNTSLMTTGNGRNEEGYMFLKHSQTGNFGQSTNTRYFLGEKTSGSKSSVEHVAFWRQLRTFLQTTQGGCPYYYYPKGFYFSDQDLSDTEDGEAAIIATCDYDNDATYQALKKFYSDSYSKGNIKATLNKQFGKDLVKNHEILKKLFNSASVSSKRYCDLDSMLEASKALADACKNNSNCSNNDLDDISKEADQMQQDIEDVRIDLGDLTQAGYDSNGIGYGATDDDIKCNDIFGEKDDETSLMYVINRVFTWVRIAVPVLLIVLGMMDYVKVVVSQDQDAMKKANSKFIRRCVIAMVIFIIPTFITIILGWIDEYIISTENCVADNLSAGDLHIVVTNFMKYFK